MDSKDTELTKQRWCLFAYTAGKLDPIPSGLSRRIWRILRCAFMYLELSTCDRITQDASLIPDLNRLLGVGGRWRCKIIVTTARSPPSTPAGTGNSVDRMLGTPVCDWGQEEGHWWGNGG